MSIQADPWSQLVMLRETTGGELLPAQIVNLKYWPRLAMPHSTSSECRYNKDSRTVEFRVKLGKSAAPRDLKKRLAGLDRSVKEMLGHACSVIVRASGKKIFESKGKEKAVGGEGGGFLAAVKNAQFGGVTRAPLPQIPVDDGVPNRDKVKLSG